MAHVHARHGYPPAEIDSYVLVGVDIVTFARIFAIRDDILM